MPVFGSNYNDPNLQAALQALGQIAPVQDQAAPNPAPFRSNLSDPRVQTALENLANLQPVQDQAEASAFAHGSNLNDPGLQSALEGLRNLQPVQDAAQAGAFAPGSNLNDPSVLKQLEAIPQGQAPAALISIKNALNGGELSPDMLARYDLPRYQMGCEKLLNMIPLPGGGITKRPGFRYVGLCGAPEYNNCVRMMPFTYSSDTQLMLIFVAFSGSGRLWVVDRDGARPPWLACEFPYKYNEIGKVSFCQCGKNLYAAHEKYPPAKFVYSGFGFSYEVIDFENHVPIPEIIGFSYEGYAQENTSRNLYYKVTAVNDITGEESLPSEEKCWFTCTLNTNFSALIKIRTVPGCSEYRIYKKRGGEFGFIGRLILPADYEAPPPYGADSLILGTDPDVFHDTGFTPDIEDTPPKEQHFFQAKGDYPSVTFLHQQRLGWASTLNDPLTIWMSQTSNFECLDSKSPPKDDDAIEVTLASMQANRILWCLSDRTGLAIGTAGEEWYLTGSGGEGAAVTPNSLSFQPQTHYGTQSGIPALRTDSSILFVQRGGRAVRDLGYSFSADRYEAKDLTLLARHLFRFNNISSWAWQGYPANILWCCLASGRMTGLTYMPEQEIVAWHRHETDGAILGLATLDDSKGRSRLWLVVQRKRDGVDEFHAEIMNPIHEGSPEEWDGESAADPMLWLDGYNAAGYKSRCIPCLPESGMENGATTMRVKKVNAIKARVLNSAPFKCQIRGLYAPDGEIMPVPHRLFDFNTEDKKTCGLTGFVPGLRDWSCPLGAGFRDNVKLELIFDEPKPATLLGLTVSLDVARDGAGQI